MSLVPDCVAGVSSAGQKRLRSMHALCQEVRETLRSVALLAFCQRVVRGWVRGVAFAQCAGFSLLKTCKRRGRHRI